MEDLGRMRILYRNRYITAGSAESLEMEGQGNDLGETPKVVPAMPRPAIPTTTGHSFTIFSTVIQTYSLRPVINSCEAYTHDSVVQCQT